MWVTRGIKLMSKTARQHLEVIYLPISCWRGVKILVLLKIKRLLRSSIWLWQLSGIKFDSLIVQSLSAGSSRMRTWCGIVSELPAGRSHRDKSERSACGR